MRAFALLAMAAVMVGCTSPASTPVGTSDSRESTVGSPPCPGSTPVHEHPSVTEGGSDQKSFDAPPNCSIHFDLKLNQYAGDLDIKVVGPPGVVYENRHSGAGAAGADVGIVAGQDNKQGPTPAGNYTYSYAATQVADFEFTVTLAPTSVSARIGQNGLFAANP